jgi:hypothetical protein
MREYLRRRTDAVWVIDCSPEGHQPAVNTRIFQGVQQPICITLAVRDGRIDADTPASVYFRTLAGGSREAKFAELGGVSLVDPEWIECSAGWREPFLPAGGKRWLNYPSLDDLLRYSGTGVMIGRTWVVAPDAETLRRRWQRLTTVALDEKRELMQEHRRDRHIHKVVSDGLPGFPAHTTTIAEERGPCLDPVRIGYRSFDRQWIIPDKRLINQPNPTLWGVRSRTQIYLTAPQDTVPTSGPAATFTAEIPDVHHYKGSFGGRVYPLWLDPSGTVSNVVPAVLDLLTGRYSRPVTAEDVFAYLAAVVSNPGYPARFADDLSTPGIRVPLTADPRLFANAAALGRRVIWLHTYGERFVDASNGRPSGAPRLPAAQAPKVLAGAAIPSDPERMPDSLNYDAAAQELQVGEGRIGNVIPQMWSYNVSGVNVLNKWFSYRRKTRDRPVMGDRRVSGLSDIQLEYWPAEYTRELIDLLNVVGLLAEVEPGKSRLLGAICGGPLISTDDLMEAGALPVPAAARRVPRTWPDHASDKSTLW